MPTSKRAFVLGLPQEPCAVSYMNDVAVSKKGDECQCVGMTGREEGAGHLLFQLICQATVMRLLGLQLILKHVHSPAKR